MWALKNRRDDCAMMLLNAGADTRLRDNGGFLAVDYARGRAAGTKGPNGLMVAKVLAAASRFNRKDEL